MTTNYSRIASSTEGERKRKRLYRWVSVFVLVLGGSIGVSVVLEFAGFPVIAGLLATTGLLFAAGVLVIIVVGVIMYLINRNTAERPA